MVPKKRKTRNYSKIPEPVAKPFHDERSNMNFYEEYQFNAPNYDVQSRDRNGLKS